MPTVFPRFDIPLKYSSDAKRDEYRSTSALTAPISSLHFDVTAITAPGGTKTQRRFDGRVRFEPDVGIKGNYSVKAVIDRMVIVVMIAEPTTYSGIRKVIKDAVGVSLAAKDVGVRVHRDEWTKRIILPLPMRNQGTCRIFAILLQDPTPDLVADIVAAVDQGFRIIGDVLLTLLEVALDFQAYRDFDQATRVRLREQMVGLLQRLHHTDAKMFELYGSDARQVIEQLSPNRLLTQYLFSSPKNAGRKRPDTDMTEEVVRKRLKHGSVGNQLWLDSTLYKGSTSEGLLFRIQHKITDRRDPETKTVDILPDEQRRARIEVEISDMTELESLGLATLAGFQTFDFRAIHKKYLRLWFPTGGTDVASDLMMRQQLTDRGIYGCEIAQLLVEYELKQTHALAKKTGTPAKRERTSTGPSTKRKAWSECNQVAGDAMDALTEVWQEFRLTRP